MNCKQLTINSQKGFSVIEVILAAALFMIFSTGAMVVVLQGFDGNRLGEEETIANQYAAEGLEAVKSIKNQAFTNLTTSNATDVAPNGSNNWSFAGTQNIFNSGKDYTRVLTVNDVFRDLNGHIVTNGGTIDPLTKKVTSTVTWNASPTRNNTTILTTYLSDWRKPLTSQGGMLVYGNGTNPNIDAIHYRLLDSTTGTWGSVQTNTVDIDSTTTNRRLRAIRAYASSTRNEKVIVSRHYNGSSQFLYAQVYNGTSWGNKIDLSNWNATNFLEVRNFDGTYLGNGDFMVVYSDNTSTPKFRVWNGTSWNPPNGSSGTSLQNLANNGVSDIPVYIVTKARPQTNEIMVAMFDQERDTNTQYFNGGLYSTANWTLHPRHAATAPSTREMVDFNWSPVTPTIGALIYASATNDKRMNIKIYTTTSGWSSVSNTPSQGTLGPMSITAQTIGSANFLACDQDRSRDILCFLGNSAGTWLTPSNNTLTKDTDSVNNQRAFDLEFERITGTTAITVYSDNTATPKLKKFIAGNPGSFDALPTDINALNNTLKSVRVRPQENSDDMMILLGDGSTPPRFYTVGWNGTTNVLYTTPSGKAFTAQGTNGSTMIDYWYDFAWDKF